MIEGFGVHVSSVLVGSKRAFRIGNEIWVSPAMYELIRHADPDELQRLLSAIPLLTLPDMRFSVFGPLPMTTPFPGVKPDDGH